MPAAPPGAGEAGVDAGKLLGSLTGSMSTAPAAVGGGTFSSMSHRMFGGRQDIAKRQLQFLQQIASNTEKTERAARNGGLVFAP